MNTLNIREIQAPLPVSSETAPYAPTWGDILGTVITPCLDLPARVVARLLGIELGQLEIEDELL